MIEISGNVPTPEFINYMVKCNPKVVVEIGCEDARDSILFHIAFPDARIIAIEGLPDNYESFLKDLPFEAYQMVINSFDGSVLYHQKNTKGIHGIFDRGQQYGTSNITLPCQKFSTFCKEHNITNVDVVKIDVEGATLEVLEGFEELLTGLKLIHIETEDKEMFLGQKLQSDVSNFLKLHNFSPLIIAGTVIEAEKSQYDEIWVSNDLLEIYDN
jgi:FkbM family methyltransferase